MSTKPLWKELNSWKAIPPDSITVLRKCGFITADFLPIDVEAIVKRLQINLRHASNPGWRGSVVNFENDACIWVQEELSRQRKRFVIAHELGHLLLHPNKTSFRDMSFDGSEEEIEANHFASELLMPRSFLKKYLHCYKIETLADIFDVSRDAMTVRLDYLFKRKGL